MPAASIHRICRAKALQIIDDSDPAHATTVATFQLPSFSDVQLRIAEWRLSYDQFFRAPPWRCYWPTANRPSV
jgi:hypothetical protein